MTGIGFEKKCFMLIAILYKSKQFKLFQFYKINNDFIFSLTVICEKTII